MIFFHKLTYLYGRKVVDMLVHHVVQKKDHLSEKTKKMCYMGHR
jgi:hypothetical protein